MSHVQSIWYIVNGIKLILNLNFKLQQKREREINFWKCVICYLYNILSMVSSQYPNWISNCRERERYINVYIICIIYCLLYLANIQTDLKLQQKKERLISLKCVMYNLYNILSMVSSQYPDWISNYIQINSAKTVQKREKREPKKR